MKNNLRDFSLQEIGNTLKELKEPKFRSEQVFSWVHGKGVSSFHEMRNLPKTLLEKLSARYSIAALKKLKEQRSKDGTVKYLWALYDGETVESVLLSDEGRRTICLSAQVGCKMNCSICATALIKFKRNLTAGEIVSQVYEIEKENGKISNLVYMGMGEPLDNYDNVIKSIRILNHPSGKNIGQRRITISTCGLIPGIKKLAEEKMQVRLAVSINAPTDEARIKLVPINKKYPLEKLISAVGEYNKKTGRRATFEYVLIEDLNDSPKDAQALAKLLKGVKSNVNLIEYNPFSGSEFRSSGREKIKKFRQVLESVGVEVSQRFKRGQDIDAACGQLKGRYNEEQD